MTKQTRATAYYVRVSSFAQDIRSQLPELEADAKRRSEPVVWYSDKVSGKSMDRPGWKKLEADFRAGKIGCIVVWRLDRLGRTFSGLALLFDELQARKINLISLRDGFDFSTCRPDARGCAGKPKCL